MSEWGRKYPNGDYCLAPNYLIQAAQEYFGRTNPVESKKFVITIQTYSESTDWVLSLANVKQTLGDAIGYSGDLWIEDVEAYVPPGKAYAGKIPTIKQVRALLGIGLKDAKSIVDAAEAMGSFTWSDVTVETSDHGNTYTVTDAR